MKGFRITQTFLKVGKVALIAIITMFITGIVCAQTKQNTVKKEQTTQQKQQNYYCKWCGNRYSSVKTLTSGTCPNSPTKKHELYEGSEKSQYTCKYCGNKYSSLKTLTNGSCPNSPTKKHQPAL